MAEEATRAPCLHTDKATSVQDKLRMPDLCLCELGTLFCLVQDFGQLGQDSGAAGQIPKDGPPVMNSPMMALRKPAIARRPTQTCMWRAQLRLTCQKQRTAQGITVGC